MWWARMGRDNMLPERLHLCGHQRLLFAVPAQLGDNYGRFRDHFDCDNYPDRTGDIHDNRHGGG